MIISIDITKFSPKMNRKFMLDHHDMILGMTAAPKGTKVSKLFNRLVVGINKRVVRASYSSKTGEFQGWLWTSNSLLHANIVAFAVNRLKALEVIPWGMLVLPMVNIDEAIMAFQFTTLMKEGEKENK